MLTILEGSTFCMGGEGQAAEYAATYLRIAAVGLPAAFLALGGQGYLRGVADLRTPLVIVIAANAVNLVLEVLFVYGFDWGIEGSAWGTVIAQVGMRVLPSRWPARFANSGAGT